MDIILHIGIAQFIFAGLLVITKKPLHFSDKVLSSWLALMSIFMGLTLMKQEFPQSFWAKLQLYPFAFTFGPFIYYYVKTLVTEEYRWVWTDWLHLIPFAFYSVLAVTLDTPVDEDILSGKSFRPGMLFYSVPAGISFVAYIYLTLQMQARHQENILNHFSYRSEWISLNWLRITTIGFIITLALTLAISLIIVFTDELFLNPGVILFLGFAAFGYAVGFYGIRQPVIFKKKEKKVLESVDERFVDLIEEEEGLTSDQMLISSSQKYARSSLTEEIADEYSRKLIEFMETDQPFMRRDLNIQDIADSLDIPQHHLTQTINEHMEKNFYLLVNEYRIEEVKKRLLDKKYKHLTILAIAHDAGFNSKSSFNMIFKKHTGLTPTEFRKKHG